MHTHEVGVSKELDISDDVAKEDHLDRVWAVDSRVLLGAARAEAGMLRCGAAWTFSEVFWWFLLAAFCKAVVDQGLLCDVFMWLRVWKVEF